MNRLFLAALASLFLWLGATTASAQDADRQQARAEFDRGVSLYAAENYQGALEAFQEAFRLSPHPTVRVNMANCYDHLSKPIEAIFHFERYLAESGRGAPAAQRREVESALRTLRARVGELSLRVSPDGATVVIDEGDSRRAPILEPVRLAAGTHRIETRLAGYRTDRRTVEIPGGGAAELAIRLERAGSPEVATAATLPRAEPAAAVTPRPEPAAATPAAATPTPRTPPRTEPAPAPAPAPADDDASTETAPSEALTAPTAPPADETPTPADDGPGLVFTLPTLATAAGAGALVITAIILGASAASADAEFDDLAALTNDTRIDEAERATLRAQAVDKADSANGLALAADIVGVAGLLGLGAAAFLFMVDQGESGERASASRGTSIAVHPTFSRDQAGLMLRGNF
jgi:tetratricopeptide (TPR) repeat protein